MRAKFLATTPVQVGATENVRDGTTRSGDELDGNPPKKAKGAGAVAVAVAHPTS